MKSLALLCILLTAPGLAGCLAAEEVGTATATVDDAAETTEPRLVVVHEFTDLLVGAHPPSPFEWQGGASDALPVVHEETFILDKGAIRLRLTGGPNEGTGDARVEVFGPDGSLVAVSQQKRGVGFPDAAGVTLTYEPPGMGPVLAPGKYAVVYRLVGVFAFDVSIDVSYP